jgi:transposase
VKRRLAKVNPCRMNLLLRKKFTQKQLITFTANLQTSLIGIEACPGAHFLGRALRAQATT